MINAIKIVFSILFNYNNIIISSYIILYLSNKIN